uniref:arylamine N-acetyltransferase family protein n=1 Tax=Thaumasiovibrio occultus TaxID=1891184 RepID=UPI000B3612AD|nr:arylamine N-acetyltransferase [Thaumasiovibrio occultus]
MQTNDFDAYKAKLGLSDDKLTADLATLHRIHQAQHRRLPFENSDIALGKGISTDPSAIVEKLIYNERGGYCFELNGLLLMALQNVGFDAKPLLARVHLSGTPSARTHQVVAVNLEGQVWIVDAGFGSNTPRSPIPFTTNAQITTDTQTLRFVRHPEFGHLLQLLTDPADEQWLDLYSLDFSPVQEADIVCGNFFTSASPASHFTTSRVAALPTSSGIITLANYTLKIRHDDEVKVLTLDDNQSYLDALKRHFNIELNASYTDLALLPDEQCNT